MPALHERHQVLRAARGTRHIDLPPAPAVTQSANDPPDSLIIHQAIVRAATYRRLMRLLPAIASGTSWVTIHAVRSRETSESPVVELVPMTDATFRTWRTRLVPEYAAEHVRAGNWTADEALGKAEQQFRTLLPDGSATPGHHMWTIRDSAGGDVGVLWVEVRPDRPERAYIFDIEIAESRRGEGFGTAALTALESWAQRQGVSSIGLHVFAHNTGAWRLYKRQGYVETDVNMEKRL
jgi:RimJ/RimL family protein N-acetyltransferase